MLVWRNTTGAAHHEGRRVTYGLAFGSSDLIGLLGPHGRVTEHQARFLARVRQHGGIAAVARSVDDARAMIGRARKETSHG